MEKGGEKEKEDRMKEGRGEGERTRGEGKRGEEGGEREANMANNMQVDTSYIDDTHQNND